MTGNRTFTRVPKKTFTEAEASILIDHISSKAEQMSGEKIPAYAKGYLISTLTRLAAISPAAARELMADVQWINRATVN